MRVFVATTQAVDLIHGGVKVNALPEVATGAFDLMNRSSLRSRGQPPHCFVSGSLCFAI
jgi:hypothetical protein